MEQTKADLLEIIKQYEADNHRLYSEHRALLLRQPKAPIIHGLTDFYDYRDAKGNIAGCNWGLARDKFVALEIPPREPLLTTLGETVLYSASINQILGWRGCGKTLFALSMAGAMATGGRFLDFTATRAARVAYVDGELPAAQLQERAKQFTTPSDNLLLISADQTGPINLGADKPWEQLLITLDLNDIEVLFLDSLSTLFRLEMNEEAQQIGLQDRLQQLRSRGICVITLHHLGKSGLQRGHSRQDDVLDIQIQLSQPRNWAPGDGLCFELEYKKVRHSARLPQGYTVTLTMDGTWAKDADEGAEGRIRDMIADGKSIRQIAAALDIDRSKVHRIQKKMGLQTLNSAAKVGPQEPKK